MEVGKGSMKSGKQRAPRPRSRSEWRSVDRTELLEREGRNEVRCWALAPVHHPTDLNGLPLPTRRGKAQLPFLHVLDNSTRPKNSASWAWTPVSGAWLDSTATQFGLVVRAHPTKRGRWKFLLVREGRR